MREANSLLLSVPACWLTLENYVAATTDAQFFHGIYPTCLVSLYPDFKGPAEP